MSECVTIGNATLYHGDCRDVMRGMDADSIDSIVTDPPYGLSFMGKDWDHGIPGEHFWAEALRVAKPGAHLLAFGGTRTFHRLACAIEDAGWEIRDCVMWVYGSGFPKSLDVSKAIDKTRDDAGDIECVRKWLEQQRIRVGIPRKDVNDALGLASNGGGLMSSWTTNGTTKAVPRWGQWLQLKALLSFSDEMDAEVWRLNGRKGMPGEAWNEREFISLSEHRSGIANGTEGHRTVGGTRAEHVAITAPATDAARQWQGWGTALKPAWEPIIVARKPLIGTVAENVLKHGTGALNIDGSRVEASDDRSARYNGKASLGGNGVVAYVGRMANVWNAPEGRWPANLIHDGSDEVVALFPETTSGGGEKSKRNSDWYEGGPLKPVTGESMGGDTGSAARFFYCAKASKEDRDGLIDGFPQIRVALPGKSEGFNPATGKMSGNSNFQLRQNHHPTVKPTELMRYLCRLVTPPGGIVFDPFGGSGSTGVAALADGFRFVCCEIEREYMDIAQTRIENAQRQARMFA